MHALTMLPCPHRLAGSCLMPHCHISFAVFALVFESMRFEMGKVTAPSTILALPLTIEIFVNHKTLHCSAIVAHRT